MSRTARDTAMPPGSAMRLDARGEIDAVAEDVLVLLVDDDLAEMDADAEQHALALRRAPR